jgi:hypothetical protein
MQGTGGNQKDANATQAQSGGQQSRGGELGGQTAAAGRSTAAAAAAAVPSSGRGGDAASVADLIAANAAMSKQLADLQQQVQALAAGGSGAEGQPTAAIHATSSKPAAAASAAPATTTSSKDEQPQLDGAAGSCTVEVPEPPSHPPPAAEAAADKPSSIFGSRRRRPGTSPQKAEKPAPAWASGLLAYSMGLGAGEGPGGGAARGASGVESTFGEAPDAIPSSPCDDDDDSRAPFVSDDLYAQVAAAALRPLDSLSPRQRRAHRSRICWLSSLLLFTVGLQLALVAIVFSGVLAGEESPKLPSEWYSGVSLGRTGCAGALGLRGEQVGGCCAQQSVLLSG